jgi:hypothetical protein
VLFLVISNNSKIIFGIDGNEGKKELEEIFVE